MSNKQFCQALDYSQKLLSQYQRTVFEIKEKLKKKNCSPKIINQAIKYLQEKDYLNDQEYAETWLEFQLKNRPCGRIICYKKLTQKGISKNLASQILAENYSDEKELELVKMLAQKKCRDFALQRLGDKKKRMLKINSYLKNKGFSESIIIQYLESCGYFN